MEKKIKMVLYAEPGVGKSTYASKMPNPFFICSDANYSWLGLSEEHHVQVNSWEEAKKIFAEIHSEKYAQYDTIVVDLLEDLFKWCEYEYCKKNKITHMSDLGFGKAYDETRNEFYIEICKVLNANKHVILLTHGYTKVEKDRRGVELTKFAPSNRIPDKLWNMIEGKVRYFLRAYVKGEENENGKMIKKRYLSLIPKENEFGIARGLDESECPDDIELEFSVFSEVIGLNNEVVKPVAKTQTKPESAKQKSITIPKEPVKPKPAQIEIEELPLLDADSNNEPAPIIPVENKVKAEEISVSAETNVDFSSDEFLLDCIKQGMQVSEIEAKYGIKFPQDIKIKFIKLKMKNINKIN